MDSGRLAPARVHAQINAPAYIEYFARESDEPPILHFETVIQVS
jgi:hypothetical protein